MKFSRDFIYSSLLPIAMGVVAIIGGHLLGLWLIGGGLATLFLMENDKEKADAKKKSILHADFRGLYNTVNGRTMWKIKWTDVSGIRTYRIDLFSTDLICLQLDGPFPETEEANIVISDEMEGFATLFEPLEKAFPTLPKSWYLDSRESFDETPITLFEKGATSA